MKKRFYPVKVQKAKIAKLEKVAEALANVFVTEATKFCVIRYDFDTTKDGDPYLVLQPVNGDAFHDLEAVVDVCRVFKFHNYVTIDDGKVSVHIF